MRETDELLMSFYDRVEELPNDRLCRIGVVAQETGVSKTTIRYWSHAGKISSKTRRLSRGRKMLFVNVHEVSFLKSLSKSDRERVGKIGLKQMMAEKNSDLYDWLYEA